MSEPVKGSAPLVSVVIPTRNRADLLGVAIASALRQRFRDFELIIVDDASQDGTAQAMAGFSDPRLRYIRRETRGGGSAARNIGIRSSRGAFVAFLDDDDEWLPDKLERQMDLFRLGGPRLGVVYASYFAVDLKSGQIRGRKIAEKRGDVTREILKSNFLGGTSAAVLRRECFEKAGLFDEALPSFQDWDLWIRVARHFEFDYVGDPLLKYFIHGQKIWRDFDALDRGIGIMLAKHGSSRDLRRNLGRQSLNLGIQCCREGESSRGRRNLLRAIRLRPFAVRPYLHLTLSYLGERGYRSLGDAKRRLFAPIRARDGALTSGGGSPSNDDEAPRIGHAPGKVATGPPVAGGSSR